MKTVKVKCVGYGYNWAKYHKEFEFDTNSEDDEEIRDRAFRIAKRETACDHVLLLSVEYDGGKE